jgi:hypothetical protein
LQKPHVSIDHEHGHENTMESIVRGCSQNILSNVAYLALLGLAELIATVVIKPRAKFGLEKARTNEVECLVLKALKRGRAPFRVSVHRGIAPYYDPIISSDANKILLHYVHEASSQPLTSGLS